MWRPKAWTPQCCEWMNKPRCTQKISNCGEKLVYMHLDRYPFIQTHVYWSAIMRVPHMSSGHWSSRQHVWRLWSSSIALANQFELAWDVSLRPTYMEMTVKVLADHINVWQKMGFCPLLKELWCDPGVCKLSATQILLRPHRWVHPLCHFPIGLLLWQSRALGCGRLCRLSALHLRTPCL